MVAKNEGGECDWRSFIRQIERESGIAMADEGDGSMQRARADDKDEVISPRLSPSPSLD